MYGILSQCDYKDETGRQCQRFMPHAGYSHELLSLKTVTWNCPVCYGKRTAYKHKNWEVLLERMIEHHEYLAHGIMTVEEVKFHDDIRRLDSQLQEAFINEFRK